jgi:hypothetical protein
MQPGSIPGTFQRAGCIAATTAFNPRSVSDTFTVTATAPPGQHITSVRYFQTGGYFESRGLYWQTRASGELTANGVTVPFTFSNRHPGLSRTIDLSGQNVETATISVSISMVAERSPNNPRVGNPPGSISVSVDQASITVETA